MTAGSELIILTRDCDATTIPYGERVMLADGSEVQIVQQLGDSITVRTADSLLVRINGTDADALGLDRARSTAPTADGPFDLDQVTAALQRIYDPEIPISIVELGLVYRCEEIELADGARRIEIDMTMTAPGCGMGEVLRADIIAALEELPGVDEVEVTLVWDPPWTLQHISEAARLQLGLL
jgi:probable FeS assembly SUF system protein SufT